MEGFLDFYTPRQEELQYSEARFCSLDFETTGLYPSRDEIIEVGAVSLCGEREIRHFESFVDPGRPIPPESTNIHGIVDEMVAGAPSIEHILPGLLEFIRDSIVVAHNVNFDLSFLKAACEKTGRPMPKIKAIDTCSFAKTILKGEPSYSLEKLAGRYDLSRGTHHRALDDARIAAELFKFLVRKLPEGLSLSARKLIRLSNTKPLR